MTTTGKDRDDFAYQDFLLVRATQVDVLRALAKLADDMWNYEEGPTPMGGLFERVMQFFDRRQAPAAAPETPATLNLHVLDPAEAAEPITWSPEDPPQDQTEIEFRVSRLAAGPDLSLVEFAEHGSGFSMTVFSLSEALPGAEIIYFRRSGRTVTEPRFEYHVYLAGKQTRRLAAHCKPLGPEGGQAWENVSEGTPLPLEPEGLESHAPDAPIVNGAGLNRLLEALGVAPEAMSTPGERVDSILISTAAGGAPVAVLWEERN